MKEKFQSKKVKYKYFAVKDGRVVADIHTSSGDYKKMCSEYGYDSYFRLDEESAKIILGIHRW